MNVDNCVYIELKSSMMCLAGSNKMLLAFGPNKGDLKAK